MKLFVIMEGHCCVSRGMDENKVLINLGFGTFFKDYHKMVDYYPQKKSNSDV